ncbi:MAG: type II secretion system protein [Sulfurimonadaceae bacterium]
MKRAGFTMIELIFVIVILGILAAVALPKFAGVSDQANAQKCNAFVGTLNRTIGSSMWSESIAEETDGLVDIATITVSDHIALDDIPIACLATPSVAVTDGTEIFDATSAITFGTSTYDLNFTDGNLSDAPRWTWEKQ